MSKHLAPNSLYELPSGAKVHPCRLIVRDGTIMWKHAFLNQNKFTCLPHLIEHEQNIAKVAQRLEELNVWVSQDLEPWDCLVSVAWYDPGIWQLEDGLGVYFKHHSHNSRFLFEELTQHMLAHESIKLVEGGYFADELIFYRKEL